eukprot:CAMPEP_0198257206 /NCGR_PEP_ID=MMETSP1447-20131203/6933_1 /TAXON_ID=420782 /ORGANISM="Chaetoceros dichaeta, Strain CCMP1751" /LENGTH=219 /DNA_ID=CAMNT_0043944039 /DNA_START=45 /DNA_END=704 /DNA_ORIENTATION=+
MNTHYEKHDEPSPSAPIRATMIAKPDRGEQRSFYVKTVKRRPLHLIILGLNFIVMCSAFNLALGQVFGIFLKELALRETLVRCYLIVVSGMIICNELEWMSVLKDSPILQKYSWRGIMYTFVAVVGDTLHDVGDDQSMNYSYTNEDGYVVIAVPTFETFAEVFIRVASISLFVTGALYFIMGVTFLQGKVEGDIEEYYRRSDIASHATKTMTVTPAQKV